MLGIWAKKLRNSAVKFINHTLRQCYKNGGDNLSTNASGSQRKVKLKVKAEHLSSELKIPGKCRWRHLKDFSRGNLMLYTRLITCMHVSCIMHHIFWKSFSITSISIRAESIIILQDRLSNGNRQNCSVNKICFALVSEIIAAQELESRC